MKRLQLILWITVTLLLTGCTASSPHFHPVMQAVPSKADDPCRTVSCLMDVTEMLEEVLPEAIHHPVAEETTAPIPKEAEQVCAIPDGMESDITCPGAEEILWDIAHLALSWDAGMYFSDVSGTTFCSVNGDREFHSASTIKAVYCQYLLSTGKELSQNLVFPAVTRTSASEKLTAAHAGKSYTVAELIEYAIRYSDNQAYRLLYDNFGWEEFNEYTASIGIPSLTLGETDEWAMVTPKELSVAMMDIYRTSAEDSILTEHLKNTTFNAQIAAGTPYETAHKYGYNGGRDGYHDTAIVYAPETAYVLTIMSHASFEEDGNPNELFRSMAGLCDRLCEVLFHHGGNFSTEG